MKNTDTNYALNTDFSIGFNHPSPETHTSKPYLKFQCLFPQIFQRYNFLCLTRLIKIWSQCLSCLDYFSPLKSYPFPPESIENTVANNHHLILFLNTSLTFNPCCIISKTLQTEKGWRVGALILCLQCKPWSELLLTKAQASLIQLVNEMHVYPAFCAIIFVTLLRHIFFQLHLNVPSCLSNTYIVGSLGHGLSCYYLFV